MSQTDRPPESGSTSPTRPPGDPNGRAGGPAQHRYTPSNPSSLREAHRPPSTRGSSHTDPEPFIDNKISTSPERTDFAPDPTENGQEEDIAKRHAEIRRRVTDASLYQDSPGNYSGPGTPLTESPPTGTFPGYAASYRDTTSHGGVGSGSHGPGYTPGLFGDGITQRTTQRLAKLHGVQHRWLMYVCK